MKNTIITLLLCALSFSGFAVMAQADSACDPARPALPGQTQRTLTYDGTDRLYLLYVPPGYDPAQPAPLVLSLHGFASSAVQQVSISQWNPVADEHNFVVVYPQGTGFPLRWNAGQRGGVMYTTTDDTGFISALIDTIAESLCIDTTRVYVTGLSNGGGMSNSLACDLADKVTAIGGVAGAYSRLAACSPSRPVPVIAFHGTEDNIVPYAGGEGGGLSLPPVEQWAADWAARNGCESAPDELPATGAVSGIAYTGCDAGVEVVLYTVEGGGHTWPGGDPLPTFVAGITNQDVSASEVMWAFFEQFALPE